LCSLLAAKPAQAAISDWKADSRAAENQLHAALSAANQALARILQSHPELDGMGSTLIALIADENTGTYSYISVGDSPLYLLENGRLRRINANHAFAEDLKRMIAAGEITAEEAERNGSGVVSLNGKMVDSPIIERAKLVLQRAAASGIREE